MVNLRPVLFVIGLVLSKLALFMYVPTLVAFFTGTGGFLDFAQAVVITHLAAFICLTIGRTAKFKLSVRDMFLITSLVWSSPARSPRCHLCSLTTSASPMPTSKPCRGSPPRAPQCSVAWTTWRRAFCYGAPSCNGWVALALS